MSRNIYLPQNDTNSKCTKWNKSQRVWPVDSILFCAIAPFLRFFNHFNQTPKSTVCITIFVFISSLENPFFL
ncbi:hypothetical protein BpHYR1_025712 [Brachionus plicatilis]|uniref:Uncharacterized protein n=1 Tax=Brachionus plicatilis TaxID=10195 RepID=A0A3M7RFB9_BRAPC|nr:hypothetical protein BpHYR1_025712 [Brachionus plicatilis]